MEYTAKELEIMLNNTAKFKTKFMAYNKRELTIILRNIKLNNPHLIYRYSYTNENHEIRFVFRDENYNHYELNAKNKIVNFEEN